MSLINVQLVRYLGGAIFRFRADPRLKTSPDATFETGRRKIEFPPLFAFLRRSPATKAILNLLQLSRAKQTRNPTRAYTSDDDSNLHKLIAIENLFVSTYADCCAHVFNAPEIRRELCRAHISAIINGLNGVKFDLIRDFA